MSWPKDIPPGVPDDGLVTHTSVEQGEIESRVRLLLHDWLAGFSYPREAVKLLRSAHQAFLETNLRGLPGGYVVLDSSRAWLVYWITHSLYLLGEPPSDGVQSLIVRWLARCQNATGGFGGGPQQLSHLATTYAAVLTLCTIGTEEAYNAIDREALYEYLLRMKRPSGAFAMSDGGEMDSRSTYCALTVASLCNVLTVPLTKGVGDYLARCQTYEGGIAGEPFNEAHGGYTFCGLAGLVILGETHKLDLPLLLHWASRRQMTLEGGFQGRTNKLVDGCYSFWVGALFPLLNFVRDGQVVDLEDAPLDEEAAVELVAEATSQSDESGAGTSDFALTTSPLLFNTLELQKYLLVCCQSLAGGLKDKPGKGPDLYHTCYCLSGLSIAQHCPDAATDGGFGPETNVLEKTHPVYNILAHKAQQALVFFSAQPAIL